MAFLLDSENVFAYLVQTGLYSKDQVCDGLQPQAGKNFTLKISSDNSSLLIKQEPHDIDGEASGEIFHEWSFYQLLEKISALADMRSRIVSPLHFDADNSILVFPFLSDVCDLSDFYDDFCDNALTNQENRFQKKKSETDATSRCQTVDGILPLTVATALGGNFAELHSSTFQNSECKDFVLECYRAEDAENPEKHLLPDFLLGLRRLTPETFCVIPTDALKFFRFYQRYPAIGSAIEAINQSFDPCCVVHRDPRFANFLLRDAASFTIHQPQVTVNVIDWEKWTWGDPAYDLGELISNYLKLWLTSLPVSANLDLNTTLSKARVPLSAVQPSIEALIKSYIKQFPEILSYRPNFLTQLIQFAGLGLIRQVQLYIAHKYSLGNAEMAMLQVAKSLLCQPESSLSTVVGQSKVEIESAVNGIAQRNTIMQEVNQ